MTRYKLSEVKQHLVGARAFLGNIQLGKDWLREINTLDYSCCFQGKLRLVTNINLGSKLVIVTNILA